MKKIWHISCIILSITLARLLIGMEEHCIITLRGDVPLQELHMQVTSQDPSLMKASDQYAENGKKVIRNVPQFTQPLEDVRSFFKERVICSKSSALKECSFRYIGDMVHKDIYPGSFFVNGGHTIKNYVYPVFLRMNNELYKTYATHFDNDNYEYRITETGLADKDDKQRLLWIMNHNNPDATFSMPIKHKSAIKGCCLSNIKTGVEYAVTFSADDIVFSKIGRHKEQPVIETVSVDSLNQGTIHDVCFDPRNNEMFVASYEGLHSVVRKWTTNGRPAQYEESWSFKEYGLLETIAVYQNSSDYYFIVTFGSVGQKIIHIFVALNDGSYTFDSSIGPTYFNRCGYDLRGNYHIINSSFMFDISQSFFVKNSCIKQTGSLVNDLIDGFFSQSNTQVHQIYSPEGSFLMCNSIKNKCGLRVVETVIKDAVSHKPIWSMDSFDVNFAGVGFTRDGTGLVFLYKTGPHYKVSLLNNEDKQMLSILEEKAVKTIDMALLKQLCGECREKGIITLDEDGSTYKMLKKWWREGNPVMRKALELCLPIQKK